MTHLREKELLSQRKRFALVGLGVVGVLAVLRLATAQLPVIPAEPIRDAASLSTAILMESFPFIMLGIILSIVVRVWISPKFFHHIAGLPALPRRMVMSFIGTFLPVCECGNVPLARAFISQGFTQGDVLAFTLSAPLLNPVTIVTTYQAFGSDNGILWGRILGGFLVAQMVAALTTWRIFRHQYQSLSHEEGDECCASTNQPSRIDQSFGIFHQETRVLMPPLIFGAVVAGLIQVGISRSILLTVGADPVLSVLAIMALAFIISICSSVDAFFALSLAGVFPPGAIIAFLIYGAMVDVKMLMLLRTTFTPALLTRLVLGVTILCALIGVGVNLYAPGIV